jgi:hypothetical protein
MTYIFLNLIQDSRNITRVAGGYHIPERGSSEPEGLRINRAERFSFDFVAAQEGESVQAAEPLFDSDLSSKAWSANCYFLKGE